VAGDLLIVGREPVGHRRELAESFARARVGGALVVVVALLVPRALVPAHVAAAAGRHALRGQATSSCGDRGRDHEQRARSEDAQGGEAGSSRGHRRLSVASAPGWRESKVVRQITMPMIADLSTPGEPESDHPPLPGWICRAAKSEERSL